MRFRDYYRESLDGLTNSLGNVIPNSKGFLKWFGSSKVVDSSGKPLVCYHGTNSTFNKIDMKKGAQGIFWVSSSRDKIVNGESGALSSKIIMELYVKIENPCGWEEYDKYSIGELIGLGYDGVILKDKEGFDVIVFNSNQIKSVNNSGKWGMGSNIIDEDGGEIDEAKMYHGTNVKFDKPKDGMIHWVTTNREFAQEYSKGAVVHRGGGEPIVYEHDIDVKHPAIVEDDYISITKLLSKWYEGRPNKNVNKDEVLKKMNEIREKWNYIGLEGVTAVYNHWNMSGLESNKLLIQYLELLGYDGIYYKEFDNDTYGVWSI